MPICTDCRRADRQGRYVHPLLDSMVAIGHCATSITTRGYTIARIAGLLCRARTHMPTMRRHPQSGGEESRLAPDTMPNYRPELSQAPAGALSPNNWEKRGYIFPMIGAGLLRSGASRIFRDICQRVGKFAHKRTIKLDSDFLGEIGSLVAEYTAKHSIRIPFYEFV